MEAYRNSALDLSGAFQQAMGYGAACWVDLTGRKITIDRAIPSALESFLREVACIIDLAEMDDCRIGCAYLRVIDGATPENQLRWHSVDLPGVRFSTTITTDGAKANLAWLPDEELVGRKVADTDWRQFHQSENGDIVVFRREPHGVVPQSARPGELTAVFFATFYKNKAEADRYEHHGGHQSRKVCDGD